MVLSKLADNPTYFSTISADAVSYWLANEMYPLSERQLVLNQYGKKYQLPQRMSKTMRVIRYKRFANPIAALSEGVPPDAIALSTENVDVVVEQWGLVAALTDVAQITTQHPALQIAIERISRSMAEVMERETALVLLGGSNVFYGTAAASRAALDGTKVLTTTDVRKAVSLLRHNGAMDFDGGLFYGCIPPQVEMDMLGDTTFSAAATYSQVTRLNVAEIGIYGGVRWVRSNFLPIYAGVGAPGTQSATVTGYGNETGAGSELGGSKITVIARDIQDGYERKISQEKTVGAGKDTADLTTPTSTNYVYDIYLTNTSGASYKLVFQSVAANTVKTLTATVYTNGTSRTPTSAPASGKEVFIGWVFGKDAFGRVELSGMSLQTYLTPAGASNSNPLGQVRKAGAKVMWKAFIQENAWFSRLEMNSAYSANLPA